MSERNYLHDIERQESRDAQQFTTGPCYRHDMHPDGHGGGVCECGETVSRDEL